MLRLTRSRNRSWIIWDRPDVRILAKFIDAGDLARGKTAPVDSILKAAVDRRLLLSPKLQRRFDRAMQLRSDLQAIRKLDDTDAPSQYHRRITDRFYGSQRVALQYIDASHRAGFSGFLLADQPGVGKTPPAISWAENRATERVLVITPNSAKYQWARQIERWSAPRSHRPGLDDISIIEGTIAEQNHIAADREGWVIGHWESLVHAWGGLLENPWDAVILDEGHSIRNRDTQRTQTAFCLSPVANRLVLTGHPYVNNPDELWSILHFLYPEQYASYWRFMGQHVDMIPKVFGGTEILGVRSPKLLRWEIAPFALRRTKRKVFRGVPTVRRVPRHIELPKQYRATYQRLRREMFVELEGREKRLPIFNELSRTTRVRQFLVDPSLLGSSLPSLKYPIALELVEEFDGPPVIFTSFRRAAEKLAIYLRKHKKVVEIISGRHNKGKKRDDVQRKFLGGELDAVIIVTQAGGSALNYGRYGYVVFLDLPWNAMELEQAEGRVDRPDDETGEVTATTAYRIVIRGSYEERLEERIEEKHEKFEEVFRMSSKQLRALFK